MKPQKKKHNKQTYTRRQVIKILREVCFHQRRICGLPLYFTEKYIGVNGREELLNVINNDCDIEKMPHGFERYL